MSGPQKAHVFTIHIPIAPNMLEGGAETHPKAPNMFEGVVKLVIEIVIEVVIEVAIEAATAAC